MGLFSTARLVVLVTSIVFATIVLGLAADLVSITESNAGLYWNFSALGVATAVLTFVTLIFMVVIDAYRRGAFTSRVVVEAVWLSILWVLWLSTGAYAAYTDSLVFIGSDCSFVNPTASLVCGEFKAIEAFSFLTWIILMGYTGTLIVFAFIGQSRGNNSWTTTVRDASFLAHPAPKGPIDGTPMEQHYAPPTPQPTTSTTTNYVPMQVNYSSPSHGVAQV